MNENSNYIVNAFTKTENNVNLEVDNLTVGCITSKNNNFELDSEGNLTVKTFKIGELEQNLLNLVYPVGSVYMSVGSSSPALLFGGTWEKIQDRFLLASGSTYAAGTTGGEPSHILTESEIPWHYHGFSGTTSDNGNHSHTGNTLELRQTNSYNYSNDAARPIASSATHYGLQITNDAGSHQHTFSGNTVGVGGSTAHNNMPPYLTVNVWKRIA